MKKIRINFFFTGVLFLAFAVFTVFVMKFDVRSIGPEETRVGFATVNKFIFERLGMNLIWLEITDKLGLVAILLVFSFGILGSAQWISRRGLFKVDDDILALGVLYFIIALVYFLFEICVVNYRPILLHEKLEVSYPSSHTMIVMSIGGTAIIQFRKRIRHCLVRKMLVFITGGLVILTVVGRLISGVHWFTDIVAGLLLGMALLMLYNSVLQWIEYQR